MNYFSYLCSLGVVVHVPEDGDELDLGVEGGGVALHHLGDLEAHVDGERLGLRCEPKSIFHSTNLNEKEKKRSTHFPAA